MKISPKGLIIMTALLSGVCAMAQNEITNTTKAYLDRWLNAGAENAQYSISAASGRSRSADIVARRGSNRQRQLTPHIVNGESRVATFVTPAHCSKHKVSTSRQATAMCSQWTLR